MKYILCFLMFWMFLGTSCSNPTVQSGKLTSFKGLPPGIEGCSCYFSASEKDFKAEHYLFASDMDSIAWISISEKQIALKLVSSRRANDSAEQYTETYSNGVYTLIIQITPLENTGDEVWWNKGVLRLLFKETEVERRDLVGECGC